MLFGKKNTKQVKNAPRTAEPESVSAKKEKKKRKKEKNKSEKKAAKTNFRLNLTQTIGSILDGSFLTRERVISLLPFFMFLVFLAMIYIANQYTALRRVKDIENITKELKDLRNEHISTKSELMYQSKISEVAKRLESQGIKESMKPPKKIYVNDDEE
jgi:hypothetical protein